LMRCPGCRGHLGLAVFREPPPAEEPNLARAHTDLPLQDGEPYVEAGLLLCHDCSTRYPIRAGVPVMLPYVTRAHHEFAQEFADALASAGRGYRWPGGQPVPGEQFVAQSFGAEWHDYDFDGVIWEMDYGDHEQRFLKEIGGPAERPGPFLEVGCGI